MAQVKKKAVRDAILSAAKQLFTSGGYSGTTLADIAEASGVATSNIYNYFPSKLRILYALYEPWLDHRLDKLALEAPRIDDPAKRLRKILMCVVYELPSANNCFANNVLQALSTLAVGEPYSRDLLVRSEEKVARIIRDALPEACRESIDESLLAHLLFMAFDGFAINYRIVGPSKQQPAAIVDMLCNLILGDVSPETAPGRVRPRRLNTRQSEMSGSAAG